MIIFWVDDIITAASNECVLNSVKGSLSRKFKMKDLGELRWFQGIEFKKTDEGVTMSRRKYFEKILRKFL